MKHYTYQKALKAISTGAALLMLAACSDGGSESTNVIDMDDLLAANNYVEGKSGTWGDITYGSEDAPVTVVEYASLTCPHCATFANTIFPKVKEEFIDTGKVRFIYRNYVLNGLDMTASTVARCRDEKTTKRLMKVFFGRQREWVNADDRNAAMASLARRNANMSRAEFDRCASNRELMASLTDSTRKARNFNVMGTPAIFVNGAEIENYLWDNLKVVLEEASSK